MNEHIMKEFNEYCNTTVSKVTFVLIGILELAISIFAFTTEEIAGILFGLFLAATGVMMLWFGLTSGKNQKKFVEQLQSNGELETVLNDFVSASNCLNGNLKLGAYYVYCKNSRPVCYEQLGKAYQQVNKRNGAETNRFLILQDKQGRQIASANLQLKGKSDQELAAILGYLKQRNPGMQLGYR